MLGAKRAFCSGTLRLNLVFINLPLHTITLEFTKVTP